ncbi:FAD dependent oxidoreductase [Kockovaella imperatae]|uniref:FAD dependent oxidoreductase n=1 Tax=Kockovaella imperatae TaxID=4999 RepID=A0A1Y1UF79_9TREE|nr:FAD dependent oxidoreductase [Kockovaella imperatae]ORX35725.1 FAD dependent oxidoreductase [Kockovaella imperatae]
MGSVQKQKAVIIGSGIFGMSTALWMLKDGSYDVVILEKCETVPAPDAASSDLNKIIRAGDYIDPATSELALEAVEMWKQPEWEGTYHESGVMCISAKDDKQGEKFLQFAYKNLHDHNIDAVMCPDLQGIKAQFKGDVPVGTFGGKHAYFNPIGGWAEAERGVEAGHKQIRKLGGVIRSGCEVAKLIVDGRRIGGVVLKTGEEVRGDLVVAAAGSWTSQLFTSIGVGRMPKVEATGHSLACVQLTPEEAKVYAGAPVVFSTDKGFYVFPPNPDGLVKFAIHAAGYTNPLPESNGVSVPRTKLTPGAEEGMIPLTEMRLLREQLATIYPELAKKDFVQTRMCWYCETKYGDWLIDYHPDFDNLVFATGGSGHAYKFAPIIGREILKVIQRRPDPRFAARWSFDGIDEDTGADFKHDKVQLLVVDELTTRDDLKASA